MTCATTATERRPAAGAESGSAARADAGTQSSRRSQCARDKCFGCDQGRGAHERELAKASQANRRHADQRTSRNRQAKRAREMNRDAGWRRLATCMRLRQQQEETATMDGLLVATWERESVGRRLEQGDCLSALTLTHLIQSTESKMQGKGVTWRATGRLDWLRKGRDDTALL